METKEKYKIQITHNNSFVIEILDRYKLKVSANVNVTNIIVDYLQPAFKDSIGTTITLLGKYSNDITYVKSIYLQELNMKEVAELLSDMTLIYRPKKLSIDERGIGIGVKDYLITNLNQKDIHLSKKNKVIYS